MDLSALLNYFETFCREGPQLDAGDTIGTNLPSRALLENREKCKEYLGKLSLLLLELANVPGKMREYSWWTLQEVAVGKLRQALTEDVGLASEHHGKLGTRNPFAFHIFSYHFASKKTPFPKAL